MLVRVQGGHRRSFVEWMYNERPLCPQRGVPLALVKRGAPPLMRLLSAAQEVATVFFMEPLGGGGERIGEGKDPRGVGKGAGLLREVNERIDEGPGWAAIEGDERPCADFDVRETFAPLLCGEVVGVLEEHVGMRGHFRIGILTEMVQRVDEPGAAGGGGDEIKEGFAGLCAQLHVPGEAMAFLRPVDIAGIREVTQGQQHLDGEIKCDGGDHRLTGPPPRRAAVTRASGSGG